MAATLRLNWIPNINSKVTAQRAYFRQKSIGGSFSDEGFDPPNDLPTTASTVEIHDLLYNTVYQFQIANICEDADTPVFNDNGIKEGIVFKCEPASVTISFDSLKPYLSALSQDIIKIKFSLYTENNVLIRNSTVNVVDNYAEVLFDDLDSETIYIIKTQYHAIVNGVEILSQCIADNIRTVQTSEYPACVMPTGLDVIAVNI